MWKIVEISGSVFREINTIKGPNHCHHDNKTFLIPNTTKKLRWSHSDITFDESDSQVNIQLALDVINSVNQSSSGVAELLDDKTPYRESLSKRESHQLDMLMSLMLRDVQENYRVIYTLKFQYWL